MTSFDTSPTISRPSLIRSPKRILLAALGVVCVGLGFAGVFVPGLPTTIFLIAASYLFARSCPWLEERLLRRSVFAPYLRYLDGNHPMPRRARVAATAIMWFAVASSLGILALSGRLHPGFAAAVVGVAGIGTLAIARFRRDTRDHTPTRAPGA